MILNKFAINGAVIVLDELSKDLDNYYNCIIGKLVNKEQLYEDVQTIIKSKINFYEKVFDDLKDKK